MPSRSNLVPLLVTLAACGGSDATVSAVDAAVTFDAAPAQVDAAVAPGDAGCDLGSATSAGTNENLNLFGQIVYFADGAELPAGHYQVRYLDGCMKYSSAQDWTIHAYADGHDAWWLVGATTGDKIVMPPGTVGYVMANGAYTSFDDCVAANLALPPVELDFAGGQIGVWLQDSPYSDNVAGQDNRNPKWELVYGGGCPQ